MTKKLTKRKHIRFIGKFKDLKPMGYTFQKMFAADYRCWSKSVTEHGDTIWIWDKGKEVELNSLYSCSYLIVQELIFNNRKGKRYKNLETVGGFILDMETKTLLDYSYELSASFLFQRDKKPTDEEVKVFYKRYREVRVADDFLDLIRELLDKDMIEIAETT